MFDGTVYFAHSGEGRDHPNDRWQPLALHLREVARLAEHFAKEAVLTLRTGTDDGLEEPESFVAAARCAGFLHDLGKYQAEWQEYLRSVGNGVPHRKIPHAPAGAAKAISVLGGYAHGFVPAGHHQGLPAPQVLKRYCDEWKAVTDTIWSEAIKDTPELEALRPLRLPDSVAKNPLRADVFIRMLFSCLVDADWSDTNAWKSGEYPYCHNPMPLLPSERIEALKSYVAAKPTAGEVNAIRAQVFQNCLTAAERSPGFFTLTVPTGGGKTLASLAHALKHCAVQEKAQGPRRIVYVIPYLNIIEQTANVFYEALGVRRGDGVILEHHSLAYSDRPNRNPEHANGGEKNVETENPIVRRMEENWEAPIILTTSVQFFESLFSNRPAAARKLHNIARSVVIFDECQTFPEGLYGPTLGMLRELVSHWGVTFVFCTATQPAVREGTAMRHGIPGEEIREIMTDPRPDALFRSMHRVGTGYATPRVQVTWPKSKDDRINWDDVASQMRQHRQALGIVNLKSHARQLFKSLGGQAGAECPEEVFYLSTLMCAQHRRYVLKEIKGRLNPDTPVDGLRPCLVASTQLVEAGVDFDFPAVFRAFGPLDAIGQAAGRCNREGKLTTESGVLASGTVVVFRPEIGSGSKREYPTTEYEQGAEVTEQLLREANLSGQDGPEILDPKTYDKYFATLIARLDTDAKDIEDLRRKLDFPKVTTSYRLIDNNTEQAIVPFSADGNKENSPVHKMLREARAREYVPLDMIRKLQPYLVNLWPHEFTGSQRARLVEPVAEGWWEWIGRYDNRCGVIFDVEVLPVI
jgi:CRISPR-associated endonuclease/helicase Cas3